MYYCQSHFSSTSIVFLINLNQSSLILTYSTLLDFFQNKNLKFLSSISHPQVCLVISVHPSYVYPITGILVHLSLIFQNFIYHSHINFQLFQLKSLQLAENLQFSTNDISVNTYFYLYSNKSIRPCMHLSVTITSGSSPIVTNCTKRNQSQSIMTNFNQS